MALNWLTVHWKHKQSLKALNQCLKKCKNAKIRDFFTYLGPIFFPRPIFFCTPMARTLCTIYIPVWIKKKISFYSWKKQEPVSIALSTSSSFFGLSLLARLVPMDSVLKSSYPNDPYHLYYIHPCLDQKENLFLFLKKAGTSEHCVINIIIIFWFIIISEIGPNGQCSKIVNFNRTEAGLTSKWGRISPAVQWCYQNQFICPPWQCTASHETTVEYSVWG